MQRTAAIATAGLLATAALSGCADDAGTRSGQSAAGGSQEAVSSRGVTVVGVGTTSATPDVLHANVGVEIERQELAAAFEEASAAAERMIAELRERGVAEQDIQTRDLSVRHRHSGPGGPPRGGSPSYVVRNMLEVTIRDVDRAGEVLAGAAEAGGDATRIHGVRFAIEDEALRRQAREDALDDARAKAEHYAELMDRELGELVAVDEGGTGPVPPHAGGAGEAAPPPIEPGRSSVSVQVQATWELD